MKGITWMLCACLAVSAVPAGAAVVLNEVLADPARDWNNDGTVSYRDDEWVEVLNTGTEAVDLTGWRIATADTSWRYEFTGTLAAGGRLLITGKMSYDWERTFGCPAYGLRLGNEGDTVMLWRLAPADTTLMDSVTFGDEDAEDDRSTGRLPDGAGEWSLFDALNHVAPGGVPGNGCTPTPEEVNFCETPVEAVTWGRVKERFTNE
jgi:hypothetical protein